ncbi:MAG: hypothetical protein M1617_07255 [Actinobacteria bacterium]|nr:hypothetical protein [Actinomycetota bacterium]MCL5888066.1 hypothetical protein [Actinomycetota bacterium]
MIKRLAFSLAIGLLVVAAAWGVSLSGISGGPLSIFVFNVFFPAMIILAAMAPTAASISLVFVTGWALWSSLVFALWSLVALIVRLLRQTRSASHTKCQTRSP